MATMLPNALQAGHQLVLALGRALAGPSAQDVTGKKAGKHPRTGRHRAGPTARSGGGFMTRRGFGPACLDAGVCPAS
jgi:hypothetical protein